MNLKRKPTIILAVIFALLPTCVVKAAQQPFSEAERAVLKAEEVQAMAIAEAEEFFHEGQELKRQNKLPQALVSYQKALRKLTPLPGTIANTKREEIVTAIATTKRELGGQLLKSGRESYIQKDYKKATEQATAAMKIDDFFSAKAKQVIALCKKQLEIGVLKNETSIDHFAKEIPVEEQKIRLLLRQAKRLFDAQKYEESRAKGEEILLMDPFNKRAIELLDKLYAKLYQSALQRRDADMRDMLNYNNWLWSEPILPVESNQNTELKVRERSKEETLYHHMEKIIFSSVEFDSADIYSVIRYLARRSKAYDPDQKGISIIPGFSKQVAAGLPKVTMSLSNIPLSEILRYLCQNVGLKYKLTEHAVIVGATVDEMQTRTFKVRASLVADITATAERPTSQDGEGAGSLADDEEFFDSSATFDKPDEKGKTTNTSTALIQYFTERGINFPDGATIAYEHRTGHLIVKNTLPNLRKLADLLKQLESIKQPMVMIETKIVEVENTDLEELGFDWKLAAPGGPGQTTNPHWWINEFVDTAQTTNYSSNPLRHYVDADNPNSTADGSFKLINGLKILPNLFGGSNKIDLTLSVNAIAQNRRVETLFSPKVITASGTTATIRMVREEYYPESWTEPEVSINNNTVEITVPVPEFGDPTDIGIVLKAKPIVDPDNYTINLHLMPQIVDFIKFTEYPIMIEAGRVQDNGQTQMIAEQKLNILMPELSRRDMDAHVKLYDGETVVLGGMVDNKNQYRNDKWPILGDIPLLGRLFGSEMSNLSQKNLLIFVTARLVDHDGKPLRKGKKFGKPEFNR